MNINRQYMVSILMMFLLGGSFHAMAQCEFQEVMRADGTLNRNYEYATVFTSDSMNVRMSLTYQGAFKTLRVEFEYSDTIRARSYKNIYLKTSDSTIVEMYFISSSREVVTGRTSCLYEIRQKELGYLTQFELVEFIYQRKDGKRAILPLSDNRDIMMKQLDCTRKK